MQDRTILVGVDNDSEVRLIRRALAQVKAGAVPTVHFASDGEEVLAHLKGEPPFANRSLFPFPDLLLLDLRIPRLNGLEVLEEVRAHPLLKRLPVIVLSSSDRPKDIALAMEAGANSFLTKPASSREFMAMIRAVRDYWLKWNRTAFVQTPAAPRQRK